MLQDMAQFGGETGEGEFRLVSCQALRVFRPLDQALDPLAMADTILADRGEGEGALRVEPYASAERFIKRASSFSAFEICSITNSSSGLMMRSSVALSLKV